MKTKNYLLWIVILIAVTLRLAAAVYMGNTVVELPGTADQLSYHNLAQRVLGGHGFSFAEPWWPLTRPGGATAHWSFLYTFYVTGVYAIFGQYALAARLIQAAIVGVVHPLLVYWLARRLFNPKVGLVAAALVAVYPYFVYYSAALMTEPFYFVAILASLCCAIVLAERLRAGGPSRAASDEPHAQESILVVKKGIFGISLLVGIFLAAAVLLRQLYLLFVPVMVVWLWLANWRRIDRRLIASVAIIGSVLVAAILPFTIYNYNRFERIVLLNTNAGFAFYWANHPIYGTQFVPILTPEMGGYRDLIPEEYRKLDEAAMDQALLVEALQIIRDDPGRYLLLSMSRIPHFFMFWPSADSGIISNISRVGGFGLLLPFMLYGLIRAFKPGPFMPRPTLDAPLTLLILFILFYTVIHILSWTMVRYRLPIDSIFLIFAGLGLYDLGNRVVQRLEKRTSADLSV